jgi:hypothetical protein
MKKIVFILLITCVSYSQLVRPFVGFGLSKRSGFENGGYVNLNTGAEFKPLSFLHPEIAINYHLGYLTQNNVSIDKDGKAVSLLDVEFNNLSFLLSPKIVFFKEEDSDNYFLLIPKFTISKISAEETFLDLVKSNSIDEIKKVSGWQNNIGIGLGFNYDFSKTHTNSIAFILSYDNIEMGDVFSILNHYNRNVSTKNVLNFGIHFYINPYSKK